MEKNKSKVTEEELKIIKAKNKETAKKLKEFEGKRKFLSIAAYGLHYLYNKNIKQSIEEEFKERSVFLYEYLFDTPFVRNSNKIENSGFAPFLKRLIDEQSFIPKFKEDYIDYSDVAFNPANFNNLTEFWQSGEESDEVGCSGSIVADVEKYTIIGKHIFNKWKQNNYLQNYLNVNNEKKKTAQSIEEIKSLHFLKVSEFIVSGNWKFNIKMLKEDYLSKISEYRNESKISFFGAMKEYLTVVYPLLSLGNTKEINISAISISTEKIFYGYILIIYPSNSNQMFSRKKGIFENQKSNGESKTIKLLTDIINKKYIPLLAYFENYWSEKKVEDWIDHELKNNPIGSYEACNAIMDKIEKDGTLIYTNTELLNSNNPIEKSLYILWKERKDFINQNLFLIMDDPSSNCYNLTLKRIQKNLIFAKFLIASPGMVDALNEIVTVRNIKEKGREYCPSFLVIGDAGSGKDKMSKVIQLFFPEYRFGERFTINMASMKPPYLSVPILNGVEIDSHLDNSENKLKLDGIFKKIWDHFEKDEKAITHNFNSIIDGFINNANELIKSSGRNIRDLFGSDYNDVKDLINNNFKGLKDLREGNTRKFMRKNGLMPVIILDELNSLDIDAQGALLRILENKTLQALGSVGEIEVDFLVIGIVNETEEALTLERPLKKIMADNVILGGILGRVVYEHVRNLRRLREDLYYRFIREGKVNIPELLKRREDIPMLFYFFLRDELDSEKEFDRLWIDLVFFNELMSDRFDWDGNFRELQGLTKKIVQFARNDDNIIPVPRLFRITAQHLESAKSKV